MGDEPFSLVECLKDTAEYVRLKNRQFREFFNPPEDDKAENKRVCLLCFESGATKRKCCNQLYCDHCYTKNQACPYCKASTRQEKMTGATFAVQQVSRPTVRHARLHYVSCPACPPLTLSPCSLPPVPRPVVFGARRVSLLFGTWHQAPLLRLLLLRRVLLQASHVQRL